ncbi:MAG: dihydrolipoamide acetyltransferase family protein, partial [Bacillota bacterium]
MPVPVIMPKLSMTMEQGEIASWLKNEGDPVEKGEALLEINTDKVSFEVESPASGILQRILAGPGERVSVTETIGYILQEGEQPGEEPAPVGHAGTEVARGAARETAPGMAPGAAPGSEHIRGLSSRIRATPAARRAAKEGGIDLASVTGSGVGGAITSADISAAMAERRAVVTTGRVPTGDRPAERIVPLSDMRVTIAGRMTLSATTVPHVPVTALVDFEEVEELRARLACISDERGYSPVTYTDILVKVAASALRRHPEVNSSFREDGIHVLEDVNIGIAVAVPGGLMVPVIRNADRKGLVSIADERAGLVEKARKGILGPGDVGGGTFTISNLGVKDVEWFCPIINPPEAA